MKRTMLVISVCSALVMSSLCQESTDEAHCLIVSDPCLQVSEATLSAQEQKIANLVTRRQYKRYAAYAVLTGTAVYGVLYFFKMHDFGLMANIEDKKIVTKEDLSRAQAELTQSIARDYGLTKVADPKDTEDAKKIVPVIDKVKNAALAVKDTTLSFIHLGIVSHLYTKAKDMVTGDESIKWYYFTEQAVPDKAQRLMYFADQYEYAVRTAVISRIDLQRHFLQEHAYEYIDALVCLIAFMRYKATLIAEQNMQSIDPAFTSLIEAATLYATDLAGVLEKELSGKAHSGLRDEVYKTHKLIESLYVKFLKLEERYK